MSETDLPAIVVPQSHRHDVDPAILEHQIVLNPALDKKDALVAILQTAFKKANVVRGADGTLDNYASELSEDEALRIIQTSADEENKILARVANAHDRDVQIVIKDDGIGSIGLYDARTNEPLPGARAQKILNDAVYKLESLLGKHQIDREKSHEPIREQIRQIIEKTKATFENVKCEIRAGRDEVLPVTAPTLDEALDWMMEIGVWEKVESPRYPDTSRSVDYYGDEVFATPFILPDNQSLTVERLVLDENHEILPKDWITNIWISLDRTALNTLLIATQNGAEFIYKTNQSQVK